MDKRRDLAKDSQRCGLGSGGEGGPHSLLTLHFVLPAGQADQGQRVSVVLKLPSLDTEQGRQVKSVSLGQTELPTQSPEVTARLQGSLGGVLVPCAGRPCLQNSL